MNEITKLVDQLEIDIQCYYDTEFNQLLGVVERFIEQYRQLQDKE